MKTPISAAIVAVICILAAAPGTTIARQLWRQGQSVEPHLAACQRERAADHGALTSWESCMHGQIKPPLGSTTGNAEYWVLRRHCEPKYKLMIKAHRAYQSCQARQKSAHRRR